MKPWPEEDKPANFNDLHSDIVGAILFAYDCKRQNEGKSIPLAGPDAPETAGSAPGSVTLSAENLAYAEKQHGVSALDEIVRVAIQLGIEQGRRVTIQDEVVPLKRRLQQIAAMTNLEE